MTDDGHRAPPGPSLRFVGVPTVEPEGTIVQLWCDPLTGLVAYPSFADHLTRCMPSLTPTGLHLAIGDVDDLKEYVTERRTEDPTMFGHLAGKDCMERLGDTTRDWAQRRLASWQFLLCGTFGGDEVIIAASGNDHWRFARDVQALIRDIVQSLPRTCSFSAGTLMTGHVTPRQAPYAYRHFVSRVDTALFVHKAEVRSKSAKPRGDFKDVGIVRLPDLERNGLPAPSTERGHVTGGVMIPVGRSQRGGV